MSSRFDERDVLLKQARGFAELFLSEPHFQPRRFQVGAECRDNVVLITLIGTGSAGAASGHRSACTSVSAERVSFARLAQR